MSVDATSAAVRHRLKQHLFLIGFMGSGKSTVASTLSASLGIPTLDSDACLEQELGCNIADFFSRKGEQAFRDRETEFLRRLRGQSPCLISCGGGMALRSENRALMRELGGVIYLTATPDTIFARLAADTTRPLLAGKKSLADIAALMDARAASYEDAASIRIATDGLSPEEIVSELIPLLHPFLSEGESR